MTTNRPLDAWQHRLEETLRLLAADAEVQVACFPTYVNPPDEIALEFGELLLLVPQLASAGQVDSAAVRQLEEIDSILARHSGDAHDAFWDGERALASHADWQRVRAVGASLLAMLQIQPAQPMLTWLRFIKGHGGAEPPTTPSQE